MLQFLSDHWVEISAFMTCIGALARSEAMALDASTRANGILHGRRLSKEALAVKLVPETEVKN